MFAITCSTMPERRRILIVEDDRDLAELLRLQLEAAGFEPEVNLTGGHFLADLARLEPELVVLDWMLPAGEGLELLRRLRREPRFRMLPVILLTARGAEADRVRGLEVGADDYVTKPFSPRELVARIKARLRGSSGNAPTRLRSCGLELDLAAHEAKCGDRELELSDTEFRLLAFFLLHPGEAFTRRQIVDAVWSADHFITERTVDVYILRLRSKIAEHRFTSQLAAVRGVGYRFEGKVEKLRTAAQP